MERKRAKILFKKLKAGIIEWEGMSEDDRELVRKFYPFLGGNAK